MTTYLYGIVLSSDAAGRPLSARGLAGSETRALPCPPSALVAVVSTIATAPSRRSLDDIRAHDSALQAVVNAGATIAAVRFGQTFVDDAEACRHVNEHAARTARLLESCAGCVEMRLLLPEHRNHARPDTAAIESGPGTAYLRGLRGASGPSRPGYASVLSGLIRDERVERIPSGVAFAHLVRREDVPRYRTAVAAVPGLERATLAGPLPLYTFADPA